MVVQIKELLERSNMKTLFILFLWLVIANISAWISVFISCLVYYKDTEATNETRITWALGLMSYVLSGLIIVTLIKNGTFIF